MVNASKYIRCNQGLYITNNVTDENVKYVSNAYMNKAMYRTSKFSMPTPDFKMSAGLTPNVRKNIVYNEIESKFMRIQKEVEAGAFKQITTETQLKNFMLKVYWWIEHEFKCLTEEVNQDDQIVVVLDMKSISKHEWLFLQMIANISFVSICIICPDCSALSNNVQLTSNIKVDIVPNTEKLDYGNEGEGETESSGQSIKDRNEYESESGYNNVESFDIGNSALGQLIQIGVASEYHMTDMEPVDWTMNDLENAIYNQQEKFNVIVYGVDNYRETCDIYGKLHKQCLNNPSYKLILNRFERPSYNETKKIPRFQVMKHDYLINTIKMFINSSVTYRNEDITRGIETYFSCDERKDMEGDILYNKLVYTLCILNRVISKDLKVLVFYGNPVKNDKMILEIMGFIRDIKVIILTTDKSDKQDFKGFKMIENKSSIEYFEMPIADSRDNVKTYAALAQQNVNDTLFDGSVLGMYKPGMFKQCRSLRFNTTYDEIKLWWNREVYLRPGFEADRDIAVIPTLFTVVSGVPENMRDAEYVDMIQDYCFGKTILCRTRYDLKNLKSETQNVYVQNGRYTNKTMAIYGINMSDKQNLIYADGRLNKNRVKAGESYQYKFMMVNKQDMILDAIEKIINTDSIDIGSISKARYADFVLETLLNLNVSVLQLIQWFEFYTYNPNLVLTLTDRDTLDIGDIVLLNFLSLIGFDILIFVPTKYACIENIVTGSFQYDRHEVGLAKYSINTQRLYVNDDVSVPEKWLNHDDSEEEHKKKGFISRLFGF